MGDWRRQRDSFLNFAKHSIGFIRYVLQNSSVTVQKQRTVLFFSLHSNPIIYPQQKKQRTPNGVLYFFGWGAGIRTPVMSESESDALPLGDTPMLSTLTLYHTFYTLSIDLIIFFNYFCFCFVLYINA